MIAAILLEMGYKYLIYLPHNTSSPSIIHLHHHHLAHCKLTKLQKLNNSIILETTLIYNKLTSTYLHANEGQNQKSHSILWSNEQKFKLKLNNQIIHTIMIAK